MTTEQDGVTRLDHEHLYNMMTAFRNSEAAQTLALGQWHEDVPLDIPCSVCGEARLHFLVVFVAHRPTPGTSEPEPFDVYFDDIQRLRDG